MITELPTNEMLENWKKLYDDNMEKISPNRISGTELLDYLKDNYSLEEIYDKEALGVVTGNILMNEVYKEKLPQDTMPSPKCFYVKNTGKASKFYLSENKDKHEIWGGDIEKIFIGIDIVTGFYIVEGSTVLHDELNAVRGLDSTDLNNFAVVAQYIEAINKFDNLER